MSEKKDNNCHKTDKEKISMVANTTTRVDVSFFNEFLKLNKEKINSLAPKNPFIFKDDEWRKEDFWDKDGKEKNNK